MAKYGYFERSQRLGGRGEQIACDYLQTHGLEVTDRNWRAGHLELDLVARRGGKCYVVEVKTRYDADTVSVDEVLSSVKQKRLLDAADRYAQSHDWVEELRIDLMLIVFTGSDYTIEYVPDAVLPGF